MSVPPFDPRDESPGVTRLVFDAPQGRWGLSYAPPPPSLAGVVTQFWETHGYVDYAREKILPRGTVEVMVNLGLPFDTLDGRDLNPIARFRAAWISGLQERPLMVAPTYDVARLGSLLVAASLTAHGAYRLLGLPGRLLAGRVIELSDILGEGAVETLCHRMHDACSTRARFDAFAETLAGWGDRRGRAASDSVTGSLRLLSRTGGSSRIEALCASCGVSRKRLAGGFHEEVGLSPKRYARLLRFATLIRHLEIEAAPRWSQLAVALGYYDQAHLVREFRAFAGETPTRFMQARAADGQSLLYD